MKTLTAAAIAMMLVLTGVLACARAGDESSWLGDHGHWLRHDQTVYLNNPTGREFSLTIHRHMQYPPPQQMTMQIFSPSGRVIVDATFPEGIGDTMVKTPASGPGVYKAVFRSAGAQYFFVKSDLAGMVVYAGDTNASNPTRFHVMDHLQRRWWFFVPAGVKEFQIVPTFTQGTSNREDMGIVVYTPRGQRTRIFWGDASLAVDSGPGGRASRRIAAAIRVPVEPTMDGRFWSLELCNGDSHWHADNEFVLRGVPPYLAQSPDMWFNPIDGKTAKINLPAFDKTMEPARFSQGMPNTFMGDQSYVGMRGPHRVFLKNGAGTAITAGMGMYVLHEEPWTGEAKAVGPDGNELAAMSFKEEQWHNNERHLAIPAAAPGVWRMDLDGNHWFFWTEPALAMVLSGPKAAPDTFELELIGPRNWYFSVPKGVRKFEVALACPRPGDAAVCEVNAPDRCMRVVEAASGETETRTVTVPEGLDGRIWFLRIGPSSGAFLGGEDPNQYHRPTVNARLTLRGVPAYLAPTWGQWFDPNRNP